MMSIRRIGSADFGTLGGFSIGLNLAFFANLSMPNPRYIVEFPEFSQMRDEDFGL